MSKKWKRSVVDGETVDSEVGEGEAEYDAGEDDESEPRDERSIKPWAHSSKKSYGTKAQIVCNHVPVKRCSSK